LADRPETKLVEYDFQTRQAVIDFVRRRGKIMPTVKDWWHVENRKGAAGNGTSKKAGADLAPIPPRLSPGAIATGAKVTDAPIRGMLAACFSDD